MRLFSPLLPLTGDYVYGSTGCAAAAAAAAAAATVAAPMMPERGLSIWVHWHVYLRPANI